jgi:phosphatidylserine decarboxylase
LVLWYDEALPEFCFPTGTSPVITRYGYDVVGVVVVVSLAGTLVSWLLLDERLVRASITGVLLLLLAFTLYFFRDPERTAPEGADLVIAPADGKVLFVRDVTDSEYVHGAAVQISIFMSPLNVHVNRYPVNGTVEYFRHFPGEYLVAFDEKASLRNERTHIGIAHTRGRVLFKQIAGFIARRIVAEVHEGDAAVAGARFGMIKFGSRVDVILPRSVTVHVTAGETTVAGETVLAHFSTPG